MHATCGKCKGRHGKIDAVRACYAGELFDCDWLVRRPAGFIDDGEGGLIDVDEAILPCGAEAWPTDDGWACAAGHFHVRAEVLDTRGLAWAEDEFEAEGLAKAGVVPLRLDGGSWL